MAYRVDVSKNAETELEELYLWVVGRAPQQATKWFNGLERAVLALDQHPERETHRSMSFNHMVDKCRGLVYIQPDG